jgi:predicted RNA-binding protein Jag
MAWSEVAIDIDQAKIEKESIEEKALLNQLLKKQEMIDKSIESLKVGFRDQGKEIEISKRNQAELREVIKQVGQLVKQLLPKMDFPLPGSAQTRRMAQ